MPILFPENKEAFISTPWGDTNGLKWIYNPERQRWARYDDLQRATYVQATAPTSAENGQFWYDTANEVLKMWSGTAWVEAGGGGGASSWNDLTGTADVVPLTVPAVPNGMPSYGQLAWDKEEETLAVGLEDGATLQVGQEIHYHVENSTPSQIDDGTPVQFAGTPGSSGKLTVAPWNGTLDSKYFLGLATHDIASGGTGYVTHFGKVRGIQTDGGNYGEIWASGDVIYLDPTGGLTNVMPAAPNPKTVVAAVINAHAINGTLFVRVQQGSNLGEDELVQLSGLADKHALLYDGATSRFVNRAIVSADVSDATASPDGGRIVLRDATGGASFAEQINIIGLNNTVVVQGAELTFSNSTNSNVLRVTVPFDPTANRTITFPDASGTVSLVGHTHLIADVTDSTTVGRNLVKVTTPGSDSFIKVSGTTGNITLENATTTRTSLGLGTTNSPTFADVYVPSGNSMGIDSNTRIVYSTGTMRFDAGSSGASGMYLTSSALSLTATGAYSFSSSSSPAGSVDLTVVRDAANTLAQRNGTNAQTFRLYRTYTSASSYQRLTLSTAADAFNFTAESTSTSNLDLNLLPQGTGKTKTTNLDATGDITASGGAGEVDINSLYGSGLQFRSVEAVVNTTTGTSSAIATGLIPAGAIVMGVVVRVNTTITGPTTFAVGDGTTADRWGTGILLTAGTTTSSSSFVTTSLAIYPSATNVVLTASGGNFTTGAVRVCVHYIQISQLTA